MRYNIFVRIPAHFHFCRIHDADNFIACCNGQFGDSVKITIKIAGTSAVAQQARSLSVVMAYRRGAGLHPSCSTFDLAPGLWPREAAEVGSSPPWHPAST